MKKTAQFLQSVLLRTRKIVSCTKSYLVYTVYVRAYTRGNLREELKCEKSDVFTLSRSQFIFAQYFFLFSLYSPACLLFTAPVHASF